MGVTVKETSSEKRVEQATVMPNSRKKRPTTPPMNAIGRKTTTSAMVMVRAARPISLRPLMAASLGDSPRDRWR